MANASFNLLYKHVSYGGKVSCYCGSQRLKDQYDEASRNLGAPGLTTFFRITLPLISPGIWSGFLLVFARSLGEHTILALIHPMQGPFNSHGKQDV